MPAALLPVSGFITPAKNEDAALHEIIVRINAGSLSYLGVPYSLVYRWACLSRRWAPQLRTFIAQVLHQTGNLDHFLVQPAAIDHHHRRHGLLEASITAAEYAMNAEHQPGSYQPLPAHVDELQQVCSAAAFLFDVGKVFDPLLADDTRRCTQATLTPYADLARCWRTAWRALHGRNAIVAAWLFHLARSTPSAASTVNAARSLTHNAVKVAWCTPSALG